MKLKSLTLTKGQTYEQSLQNIADPQNKANVVTGKQILTIEVFLQVTLFLYVVQYQTSSLNDRSIQERYSGTPI
jgi:hypothetical protein